MIGWRGRRCSRQWQVSYCESLDQAAAIARAHTRFDGGGCCWVYKMRLVVLPDGSACGIASGAGAAPCMTQVVDVGSTQRRSS